MGLTRMLVVYRYPLDFPGKFVVREWVIGSGDTMYVSKTPLVVVDTYEEALAAIPSFMVRLPRKAEDDICILESWI